MMFQWVGEWVICFRHGPDIEEILTNTLWSSQIVVWCVNAVFSKSALIVLLTSWKEGFIW